MTAAPIPSFSPWPDEPVMSDQLIGSPKPFDFRDLFESLMCGPALPFSYFRRPGSRMYRAPLREPLGCSWLNRERQATAWQEAGRSAWIESVRAKLQSAVYATNQGWSWTWDVPGVYVRPDLPEGLQVRHLDAPPYLPEADR